MTINWQKTNMAFSQEHDVLAAEVGSVFAGCALVFALEGGVGKVKRAGGATTDRLAGICMAPIRNYSIGTKIEQIVVPASPYTVVLQRPISGSSVGAFKNTDGSLVAVSASAASTTNIQKTTDASTGNGALVFDSSFAGQTFNVVYPYVLSSVEVQAKIGNPYPGLSATDVLNKCGVFKIGRIATNAFDPLANWYSGTNFPNVKIIAGGLFTDQANGATGVVPTNVTVVEVPTLGSPWLVLDIQ